MPLLTLNRADGDYYIYYKPKLEGLRSGEE